MSGTAVRVLLAAARGGGGVLLPISTIDLTTAGDGGWNQQSDPHAVAYNGYVYIAWVDSSGNVECRSFNNTTRSLGSIVTLHATLAADVHVSPSLLVRASDHKLMAFYTSHNDSQMRMRVSTNSLDSDPTLSGGFAAEVNLDGQIQGNQYTYPTVFQQDDGTIVLYFRDRVLPTAYVAYSYSTDNGSTWVTKRRMLQVGASNPFPYFKVWGTGTEIHMIVADGHPIDDAPTKLYHLWADATQWYQSDGTVIGDGSDFPFAPTDGTEVYNGGSGSGWVMFNAVDLTGKPVLVYWRGSYGDDDMDIVYGRWNGSAWVKTVVTDEGGTGTGWYYPGGASLDWSDPSRVYLSRLESGEWEVAVYSTSDNGATFSLERQITSGSAVAQIFPMGVKDYAGSGLRCVWFEGTITAEDTYSFAIRGSSY